ncbi:MAG: HDOD domain-containing protein [Halomonadaceae bacterium]|nr:MAG: HDOD domain-containing protein [Halomonadaceae bacterium]
MTDTKAKQPPRKGSTSGWVSYLSQVEMPVLAETLREISQLTDSSKSTVNQLADVILKDAHLTSQVLRLSNTVFYNHSRLPVSTVSRAITLIGFNPVRAMAISSLVIDALLGRNPRGQLMRCLARALHGAVQARCLLPGNRHEQKEEVFIGALLSNIGEMAFWACHTPQAEELDNALHKEEPVAAQQAVLGTTFAAITRGLVESWNLGQFVREVVAPGRAKSDKSALVRHALVLVAAAEKGWQHPSVSTAMDALSGHLGQPVDEVRQQVRDNAREAAEVAVTYGMQQITSLLPDHDEPRGDGGLSSQGDQLLQLQILRELSALLVEKPDLNLVFQTVVEGIHRAVGLQRVVLLMKHKKGPELVTRKVLGEGTSHWREEFIVTPGVAGDLLAAIVARGECIYLGGGDDPLWNKYQAPGFDRQVGRSPGLFGPLFVGKRAVGLVYADNGGLFQPPDQEQFLAFSHFVQQAQLCINNLADT